jgi:hypothetical protein
MQLKVGPDGKLYAATHGRGIWSFDLRHLGRNHRDEQDD